VCLLARCTCTGLLKLAERHLVMSGRRQAAQWIRIGGGGDQKSKKAERRVSRKPVIESDTATVGMMPSGRRVTRLLCLFNIFLSQKAFFFFFIS
jgi:hypothetical protein